MEKFIAMLLMIIPGFFVRKIKEEVKDIKEIKSDTEKTVISLIYSIPVLILNLIVLVFLFKFSGIDQLVLMFEDLQFIIEYALLSIISTAIISAIMIVIESKYKLNFFNWIRRKMDEPEKTSSITPWQDFFKSDGEMPIKIIKGEKIVAQGFVKHWDLDGKSEKDIVLEYADQMIENTQCFTRIRKQYIDYKNDLTILEYFFDEEKLQNNCESNDS
ncbi:hypothetical protein FDE76_01460 [Clostridium botulinum]|uniref:Uncharacterized protein n=1 Tax=Clostridium botulinum (strain Eklund 17B / Type B) TaxID=935198 RepID=B2TMH5_CLOBB|nr:DUF6338 family protein [Clostridium sp. M14]ACD21775.1 hypothetical protein CLL_A0963 [Clostridium botulinum B str. Eklund 17B (NRP)]MBY6975204.1 hypothetical protein [Clostridium botulinum]MBY7000185.1 hypothetical protein [Clostridium botulinum]MBZ9690723.1 DUF6338 family protein [Clostridium sp. M14]MCR1274960.1 DUF6338 family protein [Clostridium botulinum]